MVEMFVSDTGVPEELLPHAESPFGFEMYADAQNHAPITEVLVSALIPIHEWVSSKLEKEVALDLNILTSAQSLLFSKEDDKSIKVSYMSIQITYYMYVLMVAMSFVIMFHVLKSVCINN